MKNFSINGLLFLFLLLFKSFDVFSSNITFRATVKTTSNESIPRVYLKIYIPEVTHAVDSMFTDNLGYIERDISLESGSSVDFTQTGTNLLTKKLSPNIISQSKLETSVEYNYQGNPELYFTDISGKSFPNHSELAAGVYFYFLLFDDGMQSEVSKIIVTEKCRISVNLIPMSIKVISHFKTSVTKLGDVDRFYVEFIKDGFVTKRDTILVDATTITRNYQLMAAAKPTADFTFSGSLKVGEPVVFDASASFGANGENLVYSWDFGNGKKGQSASIPHIYNAPGEYQIKLTVTGKYLATHNVTKSLTITQDVVPSEYTGVIKGYITDDNRNNLEGVTVSLVGGNKSGNSDEDGKVILSNLPIGVPLNFKVIKTGYANQVVKLTIPNGSKEAQFFTTLKSRHGEITFTNAEYGGEIMGEEGASLIIPFDALAKEDGSVVSGDISVSVTPVDIAYEASSFPGTFLAFNNTGEDGVLLSYGVSEYNFRQDGEQLQLAAGKTATVIIPVYTSGATIGDEILLWSINEDNGIWVEEGTGVVVASNNSPTGLALKAEIGHLSWWNCDDFDDDRKRDVLCWRWECTTAQCYKVKVGCWMSGAMHDDGTPAKISKNSAKLKSISESRDEIPPVFEVREYVSETGSNLTFPANSDVYIEARAFTENGELLKGNYTVKANEPEDSVQIELVTMYKGDTINLPLNTMVEGDLNSNQLVHYRVSISESKLYTVIVEPGDNPLSSGIFIVKDANGISPSQPINGLPKYVFTTSNQLIVTVSKTDEFATGNFNIGVFEADAIPISPNDSISDSLTSDKNVLLYSIKSDKNTLVNYKYYTFENVNAHIKLLSAKGEQLFSDNILLNADMNSAFFSKDSMYYFEISSRAPCRFVLLTNEDLHYSIAYGDTIDNRLKYKKDKDIYNFSGLQGDLISIEGSQPDYILEGGIFELIDLNGKKIASRDLKKNHYTNDYEIIYKLPATGTYSILISSSVNDTGSYQIILNKVPYQVINYNAINTFDILPDMKYYFTFEVPENKITHFSASSEINYGNIYLWSDNGSKLFMDHFRSSFLNSFADVLTGENCFVKVENENATKLFINLHESKLITEFDSKGKVEFIDTIAHLNEVNVYDFTGSQGDGIHAILESIDKSVNPNKLDLECLALSKKDEYMSFDSKSLDYYSLDSTKLVELGATLTGNENESTWIFIVHAVSVGQYKFKLHHVKSAGNITVDDDYVQYPAAQTSSPIAAGYAITAGGAILIANGVYSSYLPISIVPQNIDFSGQEKENVFVYQTYNYSLIPAINFYSAGGSLRNLTIGNGTASYQTIDALYDNLIIENIDIRPIAGQLKVSGEIKARGNNITIRNITHTNAARGINLGGLTGLVENCILNTEYAGINCSGNNMVIKNNLITTNTSANAITVESGLGQGNHRIDSNNITMNMVSGTSGGGIIRISENGSADDTNTSYVRHNTIVSGGAYAPFEANIGNPPSKIIIEDNSFRSSYPSGAMAMYINSLRSDGASTLIFRNNIFDGLRSKEAIIIGHVDLIKNGYRFALYNNNFRMAANTVNNSNNYFILLAKYNSSFTDTTNLYFVNNIFQGDGFSYLVKCPDNFSLYSDYNVLYNFSDNIVGTGNLIGTIHDISNDPLFIDNNLHVDPLSPAINSGATPASFPFIPNVDKEGTIRPQGAGYDIGAYEQ